MRNLIITSILMLMFILVGCSKEEDAFEPVDNQSEDVYYVLEQIEDSYLWATIPTNPVGEAELLPEPPAEYMFTCGAYKPQGRPLMDLTWSGFCDDTGVHGTAEIKVVEPTFSFHFIMTSAGVVGEGNNAIYEGTITEIISKSGDVPEFDRYWRFCFNVVDSHSVMGDDYDKICKKMVFGSPRSPMIWSVYPIGHSMWLRAGYTEVRPPGYVDIHDNPEHDK